MYTSCLRCDRSLGRNSEIRHLPIGQRVAFDGKTGRVWLICPRCDQWNLLPIEERWEILAECQDLATKAESRSKGKDIGFARTAAGLELLSLEGHNAIDIANWRYGRRLQRRQFNWRSLAIGFGAIGAIAGLATAVAGASAKLSIYAALAVGTWLLALWRRPPRPWVVVRTASVQSRVWAWQLFDVHVDVGADGRGIVSHRGRRLRGIDAARFLSGFLSQINGPDCVDVSINAAITKVSRAEKESGRELHQERRRSSRKRGAAPSSATEPRRPWEIIASSLGRKSLAAVDPELRVALEMATTEEAEQVDLASRAEELEESVADEKEVAAIADDLLLPDAVQRDFSALTERHKGDRGKAD